MDRRARCFLPLSPSHARSLLFRLSQQLQQTCEPIQDGSPKGRPPARLAYGREALGFRERIILYINSQVFKFAGCREKCSLSLPVVRPRPPLPRSPFFFLHSIILTYRRRWRIFPLFLPPTNGRRGVRNRTRARSFFSAPRQPPMTLRFRAAQRLPHPISLFDSLSLSLVRHCGKNQLFAF